MEIEPLGDRVLIRRKDAETLSEGGIIIPPTAQEKQRIGTVVSVGPGRWENSGIFRVVTLKQGDVVLFGKYSGSEVEVNKETLILVKEDEVFAKIKE